MLLDAPLDLSADGQRLIFARRDTSGVPLGIFLLPLQPDSVPRLLMPVDPAFSNPTDLRFSPDGKSIALVRIDQTTIRVLVFDIESMQERPVTPAAYVGTSPDWDPTGRYLVYDRPWLNAGDPDSAGGIHVVDLTTSQERALRHDGIMTYGGHPRWSPDGNWIAFWYGTHLPGGERRMATHIYRIRPNGSEYRDLTPSFSADHYDPIWIRGGGALLFEVQEAGLQTTFSSAADGSNRRAWPLDLLATPLVVVSRDGSQVVFTSEDPSGRFGVLYVQGSEDIKGTTRRQITTVPRSQPSGP
jgi:Tol biopolymer transport system component